MPNTDAILRDINRDLMPQFEEKLRAYLADQDKEWLIEQIVRLTKDVLFGFLFGDESTHTHFHRTQQELLTLTSPRMKSEALRFMRATTELSARSTWQDPEGAVNVVCTTTWC